MRGSKTRHHFPGILILIGSLFLAACSDNTTPPNPVATSPASNTTAAPTTPNTTAVPTTTAPTAVNPTSAITTVASGQGGGGKATELFANIPDAPEYTKLLSYNNYVAFRKLNNIPADATFQSLSQDKEAFTRFNNASRLLNPGHLFALDYSLTLRATAGFDLLQADYDIEAGQPPNYISLAQGNFEYAAIEKAWTGAGATKGSAGNNPSYTFERSDLTQQLQQIYIAPVSLIPIPGQKLLILGKPPVSAAAVATGLPGKNPVTNDPAVKTMFAAFGDPLSIYMGTSLISSGSSVLQNSPGTTAGAALKATNQANQQPLPSPLTGGFAFNQDATGAKTYLVANLYQDEASAKAAQPILEDRLKNGLSLRTRQPYSQYWEVASSEVKGNLLLFKLNWKQLNGLSQFVFSNDFPPFLT